MRIEITDVHDDRLTAYRNLRVRDPARGFIAEGSLVVERLLSSDYEVHSVLVHDDQFDRYQDLIGHDVPAYVVTPNVGAQIAGYDFHRGVLAHGHSRELLPAEQLAASPGQLSLALLGISDPENVGSLLRTAAAFGIRDILIGPRTISPYVRRVIRVSMASVFHHRFYDFTNPAEQLPRIHCLGCASVATTLDMQATELSNLPTTIKRSPCVLMMGNEAEGIAPDIQAIATDRVRLAMSDGVDSLNVSVAGAIFIHEIVKAKQATKMATHSED